MARRTKDILEEMDELEMIPEGGIVSQAQEEMSKQLLALAEVPPDKFMEAAGRLAQLQVAIGMQTVPPPRTIKELATWVDLWRKFSGLDAKQTTGPVGLLTPMKGLRRAPAMDAQTVEG